MVTRTDNIIMRSEVRSNKDTLYLFGDNTVRKGFGGQAREMRDEPNTIGIITKRFPCNEENCFLSDQMLDYNKIVITRDIDNAIKAYKLGEYKNLVIPPLGVGLAKLPEKAPLTYQFLQEELNRLVQAIEQ